MSKIRKNTQLTFLNPKRAGRPVKWDKGIRHIRRDRIYKPTSMHITIKVRENKADIKSKRILKALHRAIFRARLKGVKIIHYTLEFNHVHLLVEASDHRIMHQGMQGFGISFAKAINKLKTLKSGVYKHRHHLRKINSARDLKNVLHYIFNNGKHHKRALSILDPYNSLPVEDRLELLYSQNAKKIKADIHKSDFLRCLRLESKGVLDIGEIYFSRLSFLKS